MDDLHSILHAIVWLTLGIVVLWYGNKVAQEQKRFSKVLSFWGLSLLVNAALAVYIPDGRIAVIACLVIGITGFVIVLVARMKMK